MLNHYRKLTDVPPAPDGWTALDYTKCFALTAKGVRCRGNRFEDVYCGLHHRSGATHGHCPELDWYRLDCLIARPETTQVTTVGADQIIDFLTRPDEGEAA
jgi:hypothetical protein